jgi:predicted metal-dependent peptidase
MTIDNDTLATTALDRVLKARAELIQTRTFYGVLVSQVQPVISRKVPTAATNSKQHYWNPEFVAKQTQKKLLGTQAHESEHDARRHGMRRLGRDAKEWNICCDYAINCDLIDEGFELPEGALIDRKYKGMSAEDIFRSREIDRALQKQKEEQERQQQQQQDEDESDDGLDQADTDPGHDDQDEDDESDAGDEAGDDESSDDADGESDEGEADSDELDSGNGSEAGESSDESGDEGDGKSAGSDEGTGEPEPSSEAAGEGEGEGDNTPADDTGTASSEPGNEAGDDENQPVSTGDPGGCGEVLDAADTAAELAGEDAKWETVLRQAAMLSAKRGTAPGHVARELEHADHPPQDWRETLRAFYDGGATTQETWSRPNRRLVGSGLYLPGRMRDGVNKAYFLIDTSGSVTYYPGALEAIATETQAALDEGFIDELVVLYGDTQVNRVDTYRSGDEIEFDPRGGGGTVMRPMFDYVREAGDASLLVCFTDLEIEPESMLGPEPCPVLWAVVGYPDRVKQYLKRTPWGAQGIEVVPSYN